MSGPVYMQAMNKAWSDTTRHMLEDMAQMPPKTWAKYWPLMMRFLDWLASPECQVSRCDLHQLHLQTCLKACVLDDGIPGLACRSRALRYALVVCTSYCCRSV